MGWLHSLLDSKIDLFRGFLFFSIYSGFGWVLEAAYRSFRQRRFVNAGFLRGPFLPIYGIGATAMLLLGPFLRRYGLAWEFIAYGCVLTAIEYVAGAMCENVFGLRMWDYSEDRFNLDGRVCLPYSAVWAALAVVFERWIHPGIARAVGGIGIGLLEIVVPILFVYFVLDFARSLNLLRIFVNQLSRIHLRRRALSLSERGRFAESFERLLTAFPNLRKYLDAVTSLRQRLDERRSDLQSGLRQRLDGRLSDIQMRFLRFVESRSPREEEFRSFVRDIAVHPEFLRTKEFRHHDSSIYRHSLRVAFLSYSIGRFLHLDARSMARGGLLHDFFLYDWRNHDLPELAKEKFHGLEHSAIAVRNAQTHFAITEMERDIIARHMWPLTLRPPGGLESLLVSFVDKHVALREFRSARKCRTRPALPSERTRA